MMPNLFRSRVFFLATCLLMAVAIFSVGDSPLQVQADNDKYPEVGERAGVWDDGQAALWDLNIIDHFHYFGPESRARGYRPRL